MLLVLQVKEQVPIAALLAFASRWIRRTRLYVSRLAPGPCSRVRDSGLTRLAFGEAHLLPNVRPDR